MEHDIFDLMILCCRDTKLNALLNSSKTLPNSDWLKYVCYDGLCSVRMIALKAACSDGGVAG